MKQRTSQILYSYWNEVRGARLAPRRFEIEPARISAILAETFVLERVDSRTYAFRLAGTRICEQFRMEFRGRNFLELIVDADRNVLEQDLAAITDQGAAGVFELKGHDTQGRLVRFEAIILPLVHGQNGISRYVGSISAMEPPAWLGHEPLQPLAIGERRLHWPDGRPHAIIERSNRQAPFVAELANARVIRFNRRHFRVLDGGKSNAPRDLAD